MSIAPTVVAYIRDQTADVEFGYYWVCAFFVAVNIVGLICNSLLYIIDIKYHDGVLNRVEKEDQLNQLMLSPEADTSRKDMIRDSLARSSHAR